MFIAFKLRHRYGREVAVMPQKVSERVAKRGVSRRGRTLYSCEAW